MVRLYLSFIFFLVVFIAPIGAQITISNSYFPAVGDSLSTITIIPNANEIPITDSGDDQLWDFSNVTEGGLVQTDVYSSITNADSISAFPTANLTVRTEGNGTTFYAVSESSFDVLGFVGLDPTGFGISLVSKFIPPLPERIAPLEFLDFNTYSSASDIPFSSALLPPQILESLPISPDSIRIRIDVDRVDLVDAWGTVKLPSNKSYEVLRQKRVQLSESRLEFKFPIIEWVDVTDQFADLGGDFLGVDTLITLNFWAEGVKEPVASMILDDEEENVETFTYKSEPEITTATLSTTLSGYEDIYAYPNPAITYAKFDCVNLKPDYYDLKIYNILGLEAYSERSYIAGNKMLKVDLSDFRKGTYLYSLVDTTGRVITTKRLVVIRP